MNAAGIGRIADRSCDIRAMRDMPDAGRDRRPRAAGRTSGRKGWIPRIFGVAMDQVGGEPAVGKRRAVGAAQNHRAGLAQIVDHGAVGRCDDVALKFQAVGSGKPLLIDIDLDGDRHARQRAQVLLRCDRRIDGAGLRQHICRPVIDDGIN